MTCLKARKEENEKKERNCMNPDPEGRNRTVRERQRIRVSNQVSADLKKIKINIFPSRDAHGIIKKKGVSFLSKQDMPTESSIGDAVLCMTQCVVFNPFIAMISLKNDH